jgi:hypothetical protein
MRLLGEYQRTAPKNAGANGSIVTGNKRVPVKDQTPRLADHGLTKRLSADSQMLATIADEQPEVFEKVRSFEQVL